MTVSKQVVGYGLPNQPEHTAPRRAAGRWANLRGDLTGGFTAAVLTIPVSMGYGVLALSPLGNSYIAIGVLAGLYAAICGCFVAVLVGAKTTMIYSPRSIITFLIGSIVLHSLVGSKSPALQGASPQLLLTLMFLIIFVGGFCQLLFGLLRLGALIKFVPAPVIAGFQNAAAILIFLSQLDAMFGFDKHVSLIGIPWHLGTAQPLNLAVGIVTCTLILNGAKITKSLPPSLLGFLGGIASYYLLAALVGRDHLGPLVGAVSFAWPTPKYLAEFGELLGGPQLAEFAVVVMTSGVSLAIIASLDGLLCARLIANDSGKRISGNRELLRLGAGNMVSACFGGIANGINLASSFANHRSGARTGVSVLLHAGLILAAVLALSPLIAYLPRVVIAGMLMVVAIQLVDRWTLEIVRKLFGREFLSVRSMLLDLMVIIAVAVAAIAFDLVFAVLIGMAVTILSFLFRMSRSLIRRSYSCDIVRSRKTREPRHMDILSEHGASILVLELEGPIFFGTAENLSDHIESALRKDVSYVIVDLKRVNEIDSTGAKILLQIHDRLMKEGKYLLLSSYLERTKLADFLKDMGVTAALTHNRLFADVDRAIEWAEDRLLLNVAGDIEAGDEFPFAQFDVLAGMNPEEINLARTVLERRCYAKGDLVFREGDDGNELFVIAKGTASARLSVGQQQETRLMTFSAGTVFGEVALLDRETRSASIQADEDLVCYVLSAGAFDELSRQHPSTAIKLLTNLGRELSGRLRRANRTIYQLAS